jgi:hypothetical protein
MKEINIEHLIGTEIAPHAHHATVPASIATESG